MVRLWGQNLSVIIASLDATSPSRRGLGIPSRFRGSALRSCLPCGRHWFWSRQARIAKNKTSAKGSPIRGAAERQRRLRGLTFSTLSPCRCVGSPFGRAVERSETERARHQTPTNPLRYTPYRRGFSLYSLFLLDLLILLQAPTKTTKSTILMS